MISIGDKVDALVLILGGGDNPLILLLFDSLFLTHRISILILGLHWIELNCEKFFCEDLCVDRSSIATLIIFYHPCDHHHFLLLLYHLCINDPLFAAICCSSCLHDDLISTTTTIISLLFLLLLWWQRYFDLASWWEVLGVAMGPQRWLLKPTIFLISVVLARLCITLEFVAIDP